MPKHGTGKPMSDSTRKWAYAGLLFVGVAWSVGPVTIRMLKDVYDPYTLALVRYIAAIIPLFGYTLIFHRPGLVAAFKMSKALLPLAFVNVIMLLAWTFACYQTPAVTAQLIVKTSVIFVVILSFIVFHEERRVIRDPGYILGTMLSFFGVVIVLTGGTASIALAFTVSAFLLTFTALLWAIYAVWMKHLVTNVHPVPVFTVLAVYSTIGVAIAAVVLGDVSNIVPSDLRIATIGFISGFVPIALAHPVYHFAQKNLGSAFCASWTLLNPFFTYVAALIFLPNEHMGFIQMVGGCVIIAGTLWVTLASNRARSARDSAPPMSVNTAGLAPTVASENS